MSVDQPKIIVVEDEPSQREVLAYNLKAEGFLVISADNGEDALLLVEEEALGLYFVELVNGNFHKDQLQRVKTEILLNDIYSQETVQSQARTIGNLFSNNQDLSFIDQYKNVIVSLNKKDLFPNQPSSFIPFFMPVDKAPRKKKPIINQIKRSKKIK